MKAYLLFTCLFLAVAGSAIAQEKEPAPIRETLFGKDYKTQMQQNGNQRKAADARKTTTSTRSIMFTDYHQPATNKSAKKVSTAKQASGKPLPSGISAKEAAAKAPKPANITPSVFQQDPTATPEAKSAKKN
jgi:hypothetical protein